MQITSRPWFLSLRLQHSPVEQSQNLFDVKIYQIKIDLMFSFTRQLSPPKVENKMCLPHIFFHLVIDLIVF